MSYKDPIKQKQVVRSWYDKNKPLVQAKKILEYKKAKDLIIQHKNKTGCIKCKRKYPHYVLDLHHKKGSDKIMPVSKMKRYSLKKILTEINKCEVVCANCHREITHGETHGN